MFRRHIDPGLPTWPALMVDIQNRQAYIKTRLPDWRAYERAKWFSRVIGFGYGILIWVIAWTVVPSTAEPIVRYGTIVGIASVVSAIGVPLINTHLIGFVARLVFARRFKVACTANWFAFRSSYYDNGVRLSRYHGESPLLIQPTYEDDREARSRLVKTDSAPDGREPTSRRHLSEAAELFLLIRSASVPASPDAMAIGRGFRTLPVAGMDQQLAERMVMLIDAALRITQAPQEPINNAPRRGGLDLTPNEET